MLEHRWERPGVLEGTSASEPALGIERELQEAVAAVDVKLGADGQPIILDRFRGDREKIRNLLRCPGGRAQLNKNCRSRKYRRSGASRGLPYASRHGNRHARDSLN